MSSAPKSVAPVPDAGRQQRRWIFGTLGLSGLGVMILAGIGLTWRSELSREINSQVAAIRAEGSPVNWADLKTWPCEVADEENAALLYQKAFDVFEKTGTNLSDVLLPRRAEAIPVETAAVIARIVATNAPALTIVHRITNVSKCRFPIHYDDGLSAELPHLAPLKDLAFVLGWEAILKAQSGDGSGAGEAMAASLNLSESLDQEPMLISQFCSAAMFRIASQNLERVLCRTSLPDEQLSELAARLSAAEATNRFRIGLIGERALWGEEIRLYHADPGRAFARSNETNDEDRLIMPLMPLLKGKTGIPWRLIGIFERDRNFFLRAMRTNIQVISMAPPASLALSNEVKRLADQAQRGSYFFSGLALTSLSYVAERDAELRAQLRVAMTAVAIERWRIAHSGQVPETLADLVPSLLPATPVDPFDGKPLRFKRLAKGYVVYSIGPDLQDNQGKEQIPSWADVPKEEKGTWDITFTVER
jgi:hypothetical protein